MIDEIIITVTKRLPAVVPHLRGRALWLALAGEELKTVDSYYRAMRGIIDALYSGVISDVEFRNELAGIISRELNQAVQQAFDESDIGAYGPILTALENMIQAEYSFIHQLGDEILHANQSQSGAAQFYSRAQVWANRWNDAYNMAKRMIAELFGERMEWVYGDAEHCDTCRSLNGIVAYAKEWDELNVYPGSPPNGSLDCGGWRCQCSLVPTDAKKTRGAISRIRAITRGR